VIKDDIQDKKYFCCNDDLHTRKKKKFFWTTGARSDLECSDDSLLLAPTKARQSAISFNHEACGESELVSGRLLRGRVWEACPRVRAPERRCVQLKRGVFRIRIRGPRDSSRDSRLRFPRLRPKKSGLKNDEKEREKLWSPPSRSAFLLERVGVGGWTGCQY